MEPRRTSFLTRLLKDSLSGSFLFLGLLEGLFGIAVVANMPAFPGEFVPEWPRVAGYGLFGFVALIATIVATWRPRPAGVLFTCVAPVMAFCLAWPRGRWSESGIWVHLAVFALASLWFFIPGIFWLITSRADWPTVAPEFLTRTRSRLVLVTVCVFLFCLGTGMYLSWHLPIPGWAGLDCKPYGLLSEPQPADRAIFTATVVASRPPIPPFRYSTASLSVLRVQQRFRGLPSWLPFVVLRLHLPKADGEEYLIDARRSQGILMHFLPVFEYSPCSHTKALRRGTVELRLLQDGPPKSGVRIIGRVFKDTYRDNDLAPGVKVWITGPNGVVSTMADDQGVYDVIGLPAGHYSLKVDALNQPRHVYRAEADLKSGEAWETSLNAAVGGSSR